MKVILKNMIPNYLCNDESSDIKYFKQFNVYETINIKKYICDKLNNCIQEYNRNEEIRICKIENTIPQINMKSAKIINTIQSISLEGQYLSGKKLIVTGCICLNLLITYYICCNKFTDIVEVNISFSTFIIIPKDTCEEEEINLSYIIEDVSAAYLSKGKVIVSVTLLLQYLDEY